MWLQILLLCHVWFLNVLATEKMTSCVPINNCKHYESKFDSLMEGSTSQNEIFSIACGFDNKKFVPKGKIEN